MPPSRLRPELPALLQTSGGAQGPGPLSFSLNLEKGGGWRLARQKETRARRCAGPGRFPGATESGTLSALWASLRLPWRHCILEGSLTNREGPGRPTLGKVGALEDHLSQVCVTAGQVRSWSSKGARTHKC